MFPLGHIGISAILGNLFYLNPIYSIIGALIPDLVDKSLYFMGLAPSGRFIAHTLFAGILVSVISYILTKNKTISFSILFGFFIHLIQDLPYFIPWFYPFINYDFYLGPYSPTYDPIDLFFDSVGVISLYYVYKTNLNFKNSLSLFVSKFGFNSKRATK